MPRLRLALSSLAFAALVAVSASQGCAKAGGGDVDSGSCSSPETTCGGKCVSTSSDPDNCGACGTVCGASQVCSQGQCGASCSGGGTMCTPDGGKAICASLQTDPKNCGSCGNACGSGQTCTSGKCSGGSPCGSGETQCAGADGGLSCVNTQTDNAHCGTCTTTCLSGLQTCSGGSCVSACTGGKTLCIPDGGAGDGGPVAHCADLQNDATDCGSCFNACPGGAQCQSGKCVSTLLGSGTAADPWHTATALANCSAYHTQFPSATDGIYTTHPSSTDIGVYCDMTNGGVTYEDFGFGQYSATYTGYTLVGATDFTGSTQFDAAFAYLYTRNQGLTNINPSGWTDSNCCITNPGGSTRLGLAGAQYMEPAVNGVQTCATTYSATVIQLYLMTSGPALTSITSTQAGQAVATTNCATGGNPGVFVKRY